MSEKTQLLIFVLDDRFYGLHLQQVRRVVRAVDTVPLPDAPPAVMGAIDVQGMVVPVFNIRLRFGIAERAISPHDHFIVACSARRTVALAVDSVTQIVERPTEKIVAAEAILDRMQLIEGALQLDDGLVLIHDLDRFLSADEERALEQSLERQSQ